MSAAVTREKRSMAANLREALRLSWEAAPGLLSLTVAISAIEGLMAVGQLLILRAGADVFLGGQASPETTLTRLVPWLVAAVAVTLVALVSANIRNVTREILSDRVKQFTARRMHRAVAQLDLIAFEDPVVHDRISRAEATADYRPVQVVRGVTTLLAMGLRVLALVIFLVGLQPLLLPTMAVAAVPILVISARLAGDRFAFFNAVTQLERQRRYISWLISARRPAGEVRSFNLMEHLSRRFDDLSEARLRELRTMVRKQWRNMIVGQITFGLLLTAGIAILAWLYASGRLDAAALLTTVLALGRLAASVGGLGAPITELAEAGLFLSDQHAFYQDTSRAKEQTLGQRPGRLADLEVRELSFSYPSADRPALREVSLSIQAGQFVAFVGPNGSGKTTMAKILSFLYPGPSGTVFWNGTDTRDLDQEALRDRVTAVFQDHMTYNFTVAENVSLGDTTRDPDEEAVRDALRSSGAIDSVEPLAKGIHTRLGPEFDDGTSLSGGQEQRLAIARAFYRSRELVVLDEPTAALDARADHALLQGLRKRLEGCTAIVISHRFSNVRHADRIFVFDGGRIVETGAHEDLLARRGLYAEMYALQATAFVGED